VPKRTEAKCIVSIDPGVTTGWALLRVDDMGWEHGEFGPLPHHLELYDFLRVTGPDVVVCESFEFRQGDGFRQNIRLESREYIGVVNLYDQERADDSLCELVMQSAGLMKGGPFGPKRGTLKQLGLYQSAQGRQHMNDATAHLLQWATTRGGMTELLAPLRQGRP
jgi:hypothetical protein